MSAINFSSFTTEEQWTKYIESLPNNYRCREGVSGKILKLSRQNLTDKNIIPLGAALEKMKGDIGFIKLKRNPIGDRGAEAIAKALRTNSELCKKNNTDIKWSLDFEYCNLGKDGVMSLMKAVIDTERPAWKFAFKVQDYPNIEVDKLKTTPEYQLLKQGRAYAKRYTEEQMLFIQDKPKYQAMVDSFSKQWAVELIRKQGEAEALKQIKELCQHPEQVEELAKIMIQDETAKKLQEKWVEFVNIAKSQK